MSKRVRLNGDNQFRAATHYATIRTYPGMVIQGVYPSTGFIPPKRYELFVDEVKVDTHQKECFHVTFYCEDAVGEFSEFYGTRHVTNNHKGNLLAGFLGWEDYINPLHCLLGEGEIEAFNKRAIAGMKPEIELAMDMPTFITEVRSLPDLFKSGVLKKFFGNWRIKDNLNRALSDARTLKNGKLLDVVKSKIEKYKGETFSKSLAGDYLNLQFGWLPTIADAKAIYDTVSNLERKLQRLYEAQGKVFTSHYTEEIEIPEQVLVWKASQVNQTDELRFVIKKHTVKVTATLTYTYSLDILKDLEGKLPLWRAYLDALGFNNPLRTIWERIPFSFVLDWVIPVGDFLEQFSMKWIDSKVKYMDYCISQKTKNDVETQTKFFRYESGSTFDLSKLYTGLYVRTRQIPNDDKFGIREDNRFGTKQAILSGALLTTFFGGRKSKG